MTRQLTYAARAAIQAQETGDVILILVTLDHAGMDDPIRAVNNSTDITSRGMVFTAYPFELTLPDDADGKPPRARLVIDNIDRSIVAAIRQLSSAPHVTIEIIRAADPDAIEARFSDFTFTDITYDSRVVEGSLTLEDFTAEPFPAASFSPSLFPGLF